MDGPTDGWTDAPWFKTAKNTEVLGHSLVCWLVCSHRSLLCLLQTARFARALRCAHSFTRSLTSLIPSLVGQLMIGWLFCLCSFLFLTILQETEYILIVSSLLNADFAQWVESVCNRHVHFIAKNLFPTSSGVSKVSERADE